MKKAVIIGGSNGIGLAISKILLEKGYFLEICDICEPEEDVLNNQFYNINYCNLLDFDEELFYSLSRDCNVELLMITAGVGRIADFQFYHIAEIEKILTIDMVSIIKIFKIFYDRIFSNKPFYTGVMGSISGWMSSPSASVYAAAKAGIIRFVESVNIELEVSGIQNRILDISPGSFKGSKFYGGKNDLNLTIPFAKQIIIHLFEKDTRFIPNFVETYREVFERYNNDPHDYGLKSYEYKMNSGRKDNNIRVKIGYLSGTFDLFHIGHLNLLQRAKSQCDYLIVGVHNSGKWKGKDTFMLFEDRKAIVGACKYVDKVVDSCVEDSDAWELWHYDRLFVGSDYKDSLRFKYYEEYFKEKGVEIIYFPYTNRISSTMIRNTLSIEQELE